MNGLRVSQWDVAKGLWVDMALGSIAFSLFIIA